jgi:pimeloyl-ACP methyl ester carboxylesterase
MVDTRHGQMHVRTWHADRPGRPLALLHAAGCSAWSWRALQVRVGRPTYAVDRLGHGGSDPPAHPLALADYARATLDALEGLGLRTFDVLGADAGALEAIELAHQAPGHVRRCGVVALPPGDVRAAPARASRAPRADGAHLVAVWRECLAASPTPDDLREVHRRVLDRLLTPEDAADVGTFARDAAAYRGSACPAPLTVFVAAGDDRPAGAGARVACGATWVDLTDLGPEPFASAPQRALERAPEFFGDGATP